MIRTHIIPETNNVTVAIPDNYIGKKLEILVFADEDMHEENKPNHQPGNIRKFQGIFSKERANKLQEFAAEIRKEWDRDI